MVRLSNPEKNKRIERVSHVCDWVFCVGLTLEILVALCVVGVILTISCTPQQEGVFDPPRPPCTKLASSDRDPCQRSEDSGPSTGPNAHIGGIPPLPLDPEWLYRTEWSRKGVSTPQIVLRGVVVPDSARCSESYAFNLGASWYGLIDHDSDGARIVCHVEVDVSEYLVGSGPSRLPVIPYWLRSVPADTARFGTPAYFEEIASPLSDSLEGFEFVFELGRPHDLAWGNWMLVHSWDLHRSDGGEVIGRSVMWGLFSRTTDVEDWEIPLADLQQKLKAAHAKVSAEYGGRISDEPDSPMLVTDASRDSLLGQLRELGAYDAPGITPVPAPPAPR